MIALDSGDKIRGDASAATVVDYTLHGIVSTTVTQLADGQLASSIGDLYTAGSAGISVLAIVLVNTDTSARTVNLYLTPSGGTARRLIPKDLSLSAGYSLHTDGKSLQIIDGDGQLVTTVGNIDDFLEATPTNGETSKAPNSDWAYAHGVATTDVHGVGALGFKLTSKVGLEVRDMAAGNGDVSYTGYGFQPTALLVFACHESGSVIELSQGFSDSAKNKAIIYQRTSAVTGSNSYVLLVQNAGGDNYQFAVVKSYDADGFTLTWTKGGAPTGNLWFPVLALK